MAYNEGPWSGWVFTRQCAGCTPDPAVAVAYRWHVAAGPVDLCAGCTGDWLVNVLLDDGTARIEAL